MVAENILRVLDWKVLVIYLHFWHRIFITWENILIIIYICTLSNAKSADGGIDFIFGFSFYNIHVIQNPKEK